MNDRGACPKKPYHPQIGPAEARPDRLARGHASPVLRAWIFARDRHRCVDCRTKDRLTLDHIWPAVAGGREWASNLVTRCASCNSRRHVVWEREHGTYTYPSRRQQLERWKS